MYYKATVFASRGLFDMINNKYINGRKGMSVKQYIQTKVWIVIALAVAMVVTMSSRSFAQSSNNAANTLKVSPVRSDIEVEPGKSYIVNALVSNLTDEPITVRPVANDFIGGDERGTPSLILEEDQFAPTHSLKRFMSSFENVTIPANKAVSVPVEITVPVTAQAGGYFGAVRFAPASEVEGGQVNLSASVASLILLTVPGDLVEKLDLTDFDIQQGDKKGTFFNSSNDLTASLRFENKGNVQLGPLGKISVTKGNELVYEVDFNNKEQRDMVLPDGARRWDTPLKNIGSFGKYKVTGTFTYGKKNQNVEISKTFWVVPTGVIIGTIVALLLVIGFILGFTFFLRGYKKRILKKHDKSRTEQ